MNDLADIIDSDLLPPLLQDFERLIGLPATLDLVRIHGGLRIYIPTPARVHADHPFAKIIGVDRLMALAKVYGANDHFTLPKGERAILALRNARITHAYGHHKTVRELAAEHSLTERQIERIVAAAGVTAPTDRRQSTLF
ncbi:Mor transcription activator family protein [Hydrogenophaga sp.]|uniref:Mor transcription activator family protein n=1 Tax=Hydrogenophaga sp. TaxID=1904254 RepID=UPI0027354B89|nr:Mor transcription activator family protein [Hydrogenophaga sp.]MDP3887061.1 Mor transcription activator family protein [Hydrogenophaga sp.]